MMLSLLKLCDIRNCLCQYLLEQCKNWTVSNCTVSTIYMMYLNEFVCYQELNRKQERRILMTYNSHCVNISHSVFPHRCYSSVQCSPAHSHSHTVLSRDDTLPCLGTAHISTYSPVHTILWDTLYQKIKDVNINHID